MLRNSTILVLGCCFLGLTGCGSAGEAPSSWAASYAPADTASYTPTRLVENVEDKEGTTTVEQPGTIKYYRSDQQHKTGVEQFNRGNYAIAEKHFRAAVELAPNDPASWMGLAGAYDRTGRFDLADRAYKRAIALVGETSQILNNQGYSYMLRGDLRTARAKFELAYKKDPSNQTILNNIELLNGSYRFVKRDGETEAIQRP